MISQLDLGDIQGNIVKAYGRFVRSRATSSTTSARRKSDGNSSPISRRW
jgi:hypothetical protein